MVSLLFRTSFNKSFICLYLTMIPLVLVNTKIKYLTILIYTIQLPKKPVMNLKYYNVLK